MLQVVRGPIDENELKEFLAKRAEEIIAEEKELEEQRMAKVLRL